LLPAALLRRQASGPAWLLRRLEEIGDGSKAFLVALLFGPRTGAVLFLRRLVGVLHPL
jgi:hypothetical protein